MRSGNLAVDASLATSEKQLNVDRWRMQGICDKVRETNPSDRLRSRRPMNDEHDAEYSNDTLRQALARQALTLEEPQIEMLDRYCNLLWEWNEKINLTRHTTYEKSVARDLVDTLQLSALLAPGERVLDVGTGGGVPGIPLAILRTDLQVAMCESVGKKPEPWPTWSNDWGCRLASTRNACKRFWPVSGSTRSSVRAVARLDKLLVWLKPHWGACGRLLTIMGPGWIDERARHATAAC